MDNGQFKEQQLGSSRLPKKKSCIFTKNLKKKLKKKSKNLKVKYVNTSNVRARLVCIWRMKNSFKIIKYYPIGKYCNNCKDYMVNLDTLVFIETYFVLYEIPAPAPFLKNQCWHHFMPDLEPPSPTKKNFTWKHIMTVMSFIIGSWNRLKIQNCYKIQTFRIIFSKYKGSKTCTRERSVHTSYFKKKCQQCQKISRAKMDRYTGIILIWDLCRKASQNSFFVFFNEFWPLRIFLDPLPPTP